MRGIEILERRAGSGRETVVLHGGPGASHDYLLPGFDALTPGRTLIYYDQRGGGRSPVGREVPVGWREHVADLEALRVLWGIERLTIAGYSWGALLALLYAIDYPQRVEKLALVSPAPVWTEARQRFDAEFGRRNTAPTLQEERRALRESGLRETDLDAYQLRLFELSVVPYFHDPARARDLTPFRITGRTQKEVWESLGTFDLRPAMRALQVPALVLHGESDPIPRDAAESAAECLRAGFHLVSRCGHVPYVERPDEFERVVGGWL